MSVNKGRALHEVSNEVEVDGGCEVIFLSVQPGQTSGAHFLSFHIFLFSFSQKKREKLQSNSNINDVSPSSPYVPLPKTTTEDKHVSNYIKKEEMI